MGRKSLKEVMVSEVTGDVSALSLSRVSAAFPGLGVVGMGWRSPSALGGAELQLK